MLLEAIRKLKPGSLIAVDNQKVRRKATTDDLEVQSVRVYTHMEDGQVALVHFPDEQALLVHNLDGGEKVFFVELADCQDVAPGDADLPERIWIRSFGKERPYRQSDIGALFGFADEGDGDCCFCPYGNWAKYAMVHVTERTATVWAGFRIQKNHVIC